MAVAQPARYLALYDAGGALVGVDGTLLSPASAKTFAMNNREDLRKPHTLAFIQHVCKSNHTWATLVHVDAYYPLGLVYPNGSVTWYDTLEKTDDP